MSNVEAGRGVMIAPEMTRTEAQQAVEAFQTHTIRMRALLLEMFEGSAHKALDYSSFESFAAERLGIESDKSYLSTLLRWSRTERNLLAESCTAVQLSAPAIPKSQALELAKLPTPELQRQVYEQMEALRAHGMRTEREYLIGLKSLVRRTLGREQNERENPPVGRPDFFATETNSPKPAPTTPGEPLNQFPGSSDRTPLYEEVIPENGSIVPYGSPVVLTATLNNTLFSVKLDVDDCVAAVDTLYAWLQNSEIDGDHKTRLWVIGCLNEISAWIEEWQ